MNRKLLNTLMALKLDKRRDMNEVVLGLGGNEKDVIDTLRKTLIKIEQQLGQIKLKSSLYKTEAWGVTDQPDFINMVVIISTNNSPIEVLQCCLSIEKELGRDREGKLKWHQRTIDIDVLFYSNKIVKSKALILPHPLVQDRNFVLFPLAEILPNYKHPILKKTISRLKIETNDQQEVLLLNDKI